MALLWGYPQCCQDIQKECCVTQLSIFLVGIQYYCLKQGFRIIVTYDIGPGAYSLFLFEFKTFKVGALGYLKQSVSVIASTFPLVE